MCGIAGFFNSKLHSDQYQNIILEMLRRIDYRGPDELGYYFDNRVAIGSVRLGIIDLETGQQPFFDQDGRYGLVYNGELYNYLELKSELENLGVKFKTNSDTEVILRSWIYWGEHALVKFNGAFAFVIYDRISNNALLVRDRFGERPLYYTFLNGVFLFASELKCFFGYPGIKFEWDVSALESVLSTWTPLPEETIFKSMAQVPPGSFLRWSSESIHVEQYYDIPLDIEQFSSDEVDAAERVRYLLSESIRLRMRSDVQIGTYLSGGLDSTIVTKLAAEQSSLPINSFSVSFNDKEFDESQYQHEVSRYLGTKHESLVVSNRQIAEFFPQCVWHAETPLFRTALVPLYLLSKRVNGAGIKVILTGEGADEVFLGYDIFKESLIRFDWPTLSSAEKGGRIAQLYPYLRHFSAENIKALAVVFDRFSSNSDSSLFSHEMRFQNSKFALQLLRPNVAVAFNGVRRYLEKHEKVKSYKLLQRAQWLEIKTLLAGYLLSSQGDRMSLANSVENRCPFLDHNLIKFASSLPVSMRLKDGVNEKYILKQAYKNLIPNSIIERSKQPYRAPDVGAFLGRDRPEYVNALLDPDRLSQIDFLNLDFCKRFIFKMFSRQNHEDISPRDGQTFINLLSIALIDDQFVCNKNSRNSRVGPIKFSHRLDGRNPRITFNIN